MNEDAIVELRLDFLGGGDFAKRMNEMAHACDVFEAGKHFASHSQIILSLEENPDLKMVCEKVAKAREESGGYAIFVGVREVNGKRVENSHAWFKSGVQTLTLTNEENTDLRWALFKDILKQLGYEARTDSRMHVIDIL